MINSWILCMKVKYFTLYWYVYIGKDYSSVRQSYGRVENEACFNGTSPNEKMKY